MYHNFSKQPNVLREPKLKTRAELIRQREEQLRKMMSGRRECCPGRRLRG